MYSRLYKFLYLPRLPLSTQSWWIIIGLFSWGIPLFNYFWLGPRYYQDPWTLLVGTLLGYAICLPFLWIQTATVWHIVNRFPDFNQTYIRVGLELVVTAVVALVVEQTVVYVYMAAFTDFNPGPQTMRTILAMGLITNFVSVGLYEGYYTLNKWKEKSLQAEAFKREALLNQLEVLKSQVNPHFLFNSLNTLASLISLDPQQAEVFTMELSSVYRYVLRANEEDLTDLTSELLFIQSYYHLLKTRFGRGLEMTISVEEELSAYQLPPLTLQLLVENAVKHNMMSPGKPLQVHICTSVCPTTGQAQLQVRNTLQKKNLRVPSNGVGLANILTKYHMLGQPTPAVQEEDGQFVVTLPLFRKGVAYV